LEFVKLDKFDSTDQLIPLSLIQSSGPTVFDVFDIYLKTYFIPPEELPKRFGLRRPASLLFADVDDARDLWYQSPKESLAAPNFDEERPPKLKG
jgi:hypothetical protein